MCEFCGSGPECGVCGRGVFNLQVRMGCTTVKMLDPKKRPIRVTVRGAIRDVNTLAYAIENGKQFKVKYLDK